MQKTLSDFARLTTQTVKRGEIQHLYFCTNCVLKLNDLDANKFQTRFIRRQLRVVLEPIPGTNLLICPRCGAQHFNRDFNGNKCKHYKNL